MIKRLKFIWLLMVLPSVAFSQKFIIGLGEIHERVYNNALIQVDSLSVFEVNQKNKDPRFTPFIGYQLPIKGRFSTNFRLQYYASYLSHAVLVPVPNIPYGPVLKGTSVFSANFELPLELNYKLISSEKFSLNLNGALVPVFSFSSADKLTPVPEGIDWNKQVVDALYAGGTIPKSFYFNYQYGLSLEYRRFGIYFHQAINLNRTISNGYTLYDTTYPVNRRIRSTRYGLYYIFGKGKNKE